MEIRFSQSARKHRIGKQRALFVMANVEPIEVFAGEGKPLRMVWLGTDDRGLQLEIIGVKTSTGILIIHVMPQAFRRGKGR